MMVLPGGVIGYAGKTQRLTCWEKSTLRVLLVSDDTDLSVALQIMLREEPRCNVVAAVGSGDAALSLLVTDCPDLIVLDRDLRQHNAAGILAAVQKQDRRPHVIAIGIHESDEAGALEGGATVFVLKGASPMALIGAIHEID